MNRNPMAYILVAVFATVLVVAQAIPPKTVSGKAVLKWTTPTLDVLGNLETISSIEAAITAASVTNMNTVGATALKAVSGIDPDGTKGWPIAALVSGLPRAQYKIWARAYDDAGNSSDWCGVPAEITLDAVAPNPPTGVRCE
jgi:hypothetical protein